MSPKMGCQSHNTVVYWSVRERTKNEKKEDSSH